MNLNYTQNLHGILSDSVPLGEHTSQGCRLALHDNVLYCVYLSGPRNEITLRIKRPSSDWEPGLLFTGITSDFIPALISFNSVLCMVYAGPAKSTVVCHYDEKTKAFQQIAKLGFELSETPTMCALNGVAHLFFKVAASDNIFHRTSSNLKSWHRMPVVQVDGVKSAFSRLSPVAVMYQNLIHLIYDDSERGHACLLKSDGTHWTSAMSLMAKAYAHSPGITVHNGLLKMVFVGENNALEQYHYDGNALSPAVASTGLSCGMGSPALGVQNGVLIAVFPSPDPTLAPTAV